MRTYSHLCALTPLWSDHELHDLYHRVARRRRSSPSVYLFIPRSPYHHNPFANLSPIYRGIYIYIYIVVHTLISVWSIHGNPLPYKHLVDDRDCGCESWCSAINASRADDWWEHTTSNASRSSVQTQSDFSIWHLNTHVARRCPIVVFR